MKRRPRSDLHGWRPKEKFTTGLNVSQEDWDRIFGKKLSGGDSGSAGKSVGLTDEGVIRRNSGTGATALPDSAAAAQLPPFLRNRQPYTHEDLTKEKGSSAASS